MLSGPRVHGFLSRLERGLPRRARDQQYADALMQALQEEPDLRKARLTAGRRLGWRWVGGGWQRDMTDIQIIRRAKKIEAREGTIAYLKSMYDAIGFSPVDGVRKVVEHITTPTEKNPIGDLNALKLYFAHTTEEQTKKVQVDTRMLVAHRMISSEPPTMRARVLKTALPAPKE